MTIQFKIAFRNFVRKPIYSLITLIGFSIGIIASLLIYLWIQNELSYEKFHPGYDRIFRVLTLKKQGDKVIKSAYSACPLPATFKMDYPQIEYATFLEYSSEDSPLHKETGGEKIEASPLFTDNDFFAVFGGFKFIEGSVEKAFDKTSNIVLSEEVAKKLFGNQKALGKTLISDKYENFKEVYTVGGVVSIPKQTHIDFDYVVLRKNTQYASLTNSWSQGGRVYIKLKDNAFIDLTFLTRATNQIGRYTNRTDKLVFQDLADIHLYTDYETFYEDKNISSYKYLWIFTGLALLIIILAALNFSILSIARASERATEIGIKKVNGAKRNHLIWQFMGESLFQTCAATFISIFFVWIILPWFNALTGQALSFSFSFGFVVNLFLIIIFIGLVAGIYPSFYLSSFNPTGIFRKGTVTGSKAGFTQILVTSQLSIAIFFIIATWVLIKQLNYMQTKDLGIDKNNVVVIPTGLWYDNKEFKQELLRSPYIVSASSSGHPPIVFGWKMSFAFNNHGKTDSIQSALFWADEDFAKTYKLQMLKGEYLKMNNAAYWDELEKADKSKKEDKVYTYSMPIVINEKAEKILGFENPIGQRIGDKVVVGVVKDFHYRSLQYPIDPVIIINDPQNSMTMNVRIAPGNRTKALEYIQKVYRKYRDNRAFSYNFFDDLLLQEYKSETQLRNLTATFAILAIVISLLGIFGMIHFTSYRRTKEIGIRKINGAKTLQIVMMLNKDLLKWVAIAFLIACPISWYAMNKWLENFAYKTAMSWWIFALAGLLAFVVALLTVSWQSWRAATRNPVEALRYE